MSEPKDTPLVAYLKGHNAGMAGIVASDRPGYAFIGASHADQKRQQQMAGGGSAGGGEGAAGLVILALLAPPLAAPGYALYEAWKSLEGFNLHPFFMIAAEAALACILFLIVWSFFRYLPRVLSAVATAIYLGVSYGAAAYYLSSHDPNWTWGVAGATAIIGFFVGRSFHRTIEADNATLWGMIVDILKSVAGFCGIITLFVMFAGYLGFIGLCVYLGVKIAEQQQLTGAEYFGAVAAGLVAGFLIPMLVLKALKWVSPKFATIVLAFAMAAVGALAATEVGLDLVWTCACAGFGLIGGAAFAVEHLPGF